MSNAPAAARSFETIRQEDLERLAAIAVISFADLCMRRAHARRHASQLLLLCLCQGAALHMRDGRQGINDFDVWGFFPRQASGFFPPRWSGAADFGASRFGRSPGETVRAGRTVDVWGRSIEVRPPEPAIESVRRWIAAGPGRSPGFIRQRPAVVISPGPDFGRWIWPMPEADGG